MTENCVVVAVESPILFLLFLRVLGHFKVFEVAIVRVLFISHIITAVEPCFLYLGLPAIELFFFFFRIRAVCLIFRIVLVFNFIRFDID